MGGVNAPVFFVYEYKTTNPELMWKAGNQEFNPSVL